MLISTDRILVSHVGSLPRPPTLSELLVRQEAGETIDAAELAPPAPVCAIRFRSEIRT
jgi:5-methyltetrahydropteroyltriglutamate--homocysteine methyltransferase